MAWANSKTFRAWLADSVVRATAYNLTTDVIKVALFNNTITPDQNVATTLTGYNQATSQWLATNELTATGWAAGGVTLAGASVNSATAGVVFFTGTNAATTNSTSTITGAYGVLVYDSSIATTVNGVSFNYLGGSNSVTNGTFTVVWNANGIWRATL